MCLEDALLYLILDDPKTSLPAFCADAIAGGVDVIQVSPAVAGGRDGLMAVRDVCRRDDALLVIADDAVLAADVEADGVILNSATSSFGQARASIGLDGLVGMATRSNSDALLGLEVGADFLLHWAGVECPGTFATIPGAAGHPLFAAGLTSLDDAQSIVDRGVYRICLESKMLDEGDVTEQAAAYSRLLGRCI